MCQLNPRERLADLAGDHLGDVFCQLKIKKSIPRPSKGSRKGLRGHAGGCRGARGPLSMADDCAEIFYRLHVIFRSGL